jgi:hypothetical protein
MALLHTLAQSVGFIEFFFRRRDAAGDIFPVGAASGEVEGARPLGLLVVGESTAVSLGVATHELGPAAQTARRLAHATGRGVSWSAIAFPGQRLRNAPALTRDANNFSGIDIVVVMAGIVDTLYMTPVGAWRRDLVELLDDLDRLLPAAGRIVVAEIPPMDNAGSISRAARLAAGMHARRLNAVSRSVLVGREKARLAAFPTTLTEDLWVPKSEPGSYRNMYAVWSAAFTQRLTAQSALRDETARGPRVEAERDTLG